MQVLITTLLISCMAKKQPVLNSDGLLSPQQRYLNTNPDKSYDIVEAIVKKIDSTKNTYILYLQKDEFNFIVCELKECRNSRFKSKIEIGKKYFFKLNKEIMNGDTTEEFVISETVDGKLVWTSDMKNTFFYASCGNMCGLYISPILEEPQFK